MENQLALELLDFIKESPTAYHGAHTVKNLLDKEGFKEIKESEKWNLVKGGKYYVMKNESAIISFEIGQGELEEDGFRLIGAHTDSPTFKIKPAAEIKVENTYVKLNTEVYGGPILSTWFDRPLSLAGRVALKGKSPLKPEIRLVNIDRPLLIIPNMAIHMNRSVNEGYAYNKQKDTLPLLGFVNEKFEKDGYLLTLLSEELGVEKKSILDFDLFLYEYEKGCLFGLDNEFISAGRLDDLWMVFTGIKALINSEANKATKVMVAVDNEEIGSLTAQGANSALLKTLLERIALALGKDKEGFFRALSNSVMISADLAHAVHPNQVEKHDPTNKPVLGGGPVIKMAASGSYSTDSYASAIFQAVCKEGGVSCQKFVNRSDVRGGTTIGPMSAADLCIPVVDMGAPLLGMHSARELAAVKDNYLTIQAFTKFYNI
ncbi:MULTISPECIES: M18 family aminopeptidase [Clostridium]|uniref:M18 family aminopeptidase n=1 Tax=Clostridium cibarium TaxID=2762247 RepID=A0ABR8PUF8_9CLOT|nr:MULTISPECIES: M18 family aminopeptidase [Clostridium]MBD7911808.1 M18 family aminopeptidase [Clostridium cibarium]